MKIKKFRKILLILFIFIPMFLVIINKNEEHNIINTTFLKFDDKANEKEIEKEIVHNTVNTKSSNILGNIKIKGTKINNELIQGKDNEYYLDHSPNNIKDYHGSIFLDYRNTLHDRKLLIYGHNSKILNDALFHDLEKYLNKSFYHEHKYVELFIDNNLTIWEIFSVMIIEPGNNKHMKITFNDIEWIEHLNWMMDNSVYDTQVSVGLTDKIITLQTCYYEPNNSYLIINAKKIK